MATADANGIAIIQDNDNLSPLHPVFNLLGQSVSNAFNANIRIWPVANETARSAKVTEIGLANITGAKPLFVWRANAPAGRNLEFSTNGTVWNYYSSNLDDTGWVTCTITGSGWSVPSGAQQPQCRRIGNVVYFRGILVNSTFSGGFTTIGSVPDGFRPASGSGAVASASQNTSSNANVRAFPNGNLQMYASSATGSYYTLSALSYPLG